MKSSEEQRQSVILSRKPAAVRPASLEVSSRFLSSSSPVESKIQSPQGGYLTPLQEKPRSSVDSRKVKSSPSSGFLRGIWPSSSAGSSTFLHPKADNLPDQIENDCAEEKRANKSEVLRRQRSCSGLSRRENEKQDSNSMEQNHSPVFRGSMKAIAKYKILGKSLKSHTSPDDQILPGRLSVDVIAVRNKSFLKGKSTDSDTSSGTSSEIFLPAKDLPASYMAPTMNSRKHEKEDSPRYMHEFSLSKSRRWSGDQSGVNQKPAFSADNSSPRMLSLKNAMKKANSKWASSPPGRSPSPIKSSTIKATVASANHDENPTSTSKGINSGVGNILTFFRGKKVASLAGGEAAGSAESVHQLRCLHNRFVQWQYINSRAQAVHGDVAKNVEKNLVTAMNAIAKLRRSVLQKRIWLQKDKLTTRTIHLISSQMKQLERWEKMETQHSCFVSQTKHHLHGAACRVPLIQGAKAETRQLSIALREASDVSASVSSMLTTLLPMVEKRAGFMAELAVVVTQEKHLLQECMELFTTLSQSQLEEMSVNTSILQSILTQQQQHPVNCPAT